MVYLTIVLVVQALILWLTQDFSIVHYEYCNYRRVN